MLRAIVFPEEMNLRRAFLRTAGLCGIAVFVSLCAAQPIVAVSGSPFVFAPPTGGQNSNVVLPHPSGMYLYVTNQDSNQITVLNVGPGGALSFNSVAATDTAPVGMAMNPEGTFLYVTHRNSAAIRVYSIGLAGGLSHVQTINEVSGSRAMNGIAYVRRAGGDFVFVNNSLGNPNTVSRFTVAHPTGTLTLTGITATGQAGATTISPLIFASPSLVATSSGLLFAVNHNGAGGHASSITAFTMDDFGNLSSPVVTPLGAVSSGSIAVDPTGSFLFAGTGLPLISSGGAIFKFAIGAGGALTSLGATSVGSSPIAGLALNPAGTRLVAAIPGDNAIAVLEPSSMSSLPGAPVPGDGLPAGIAFSPSGQLLFVGNANEASVTRVSVYEVNSPPEIECPESVEAACGSAGPGRAEATLIAEVSDADGDELTVTWMVNGIEVQRDDIPAGGPPTVASVGLTHVFGVGVHTVEAIVSDGKAAPVVCTTSVVVSVEISGFFSPMASLVPAGGAPPTPSHAFKLGRTVPLKLKVLCGTDELTDADVAAPCIVSIARNGDALDLSTVDPDAGNANDSGLCFRYSAPNWVYNLNTRGLIAGTYVITIRAPDGRLYDATFVLR